MKVFYVGMLGCGNIGCGVWKLLNGFVKKSSAQKGYEIRLKKILVKDVHKKRDEEIPQDLLCTNPQEIWDDQEIFAVIECMGGEDPSAAWMAEILRRGKHVITANKMAMALHWQELHLAAAEGGAGLYYEASVCGAIPVIRTLKDSLQANRIDAVMGIVNGTTNYILSKMSDEMQSYETALQGAQALGFAEPDPSSDVDGYDAMYKLSILASLAFRTHIPYTQIHREGIGNIRLEDIKAGKEMGYCLKLLAIAKHEEGQVDVRVHPAFIPESHPLAAVNGAFNAVFIHGHACGDMMLYGRGAGSAPTAGALLSDLIRAAEGDQNNPELLKTEEGSCSLSVVDNWQCAFYISFRAMNRPGVLGHIAACLGACGVSIAAVSQRGMTESEHVPVVVITHLAREKDVQHALSTVSPQLATVQSLIRVEERAAGNN